MTDKDDIKAVFRKLAAENGQGFDPFLWQIRLFDRIKGGDIPAAVDVPTGLGKTAVMALWLIARAEGANVPRRLVYVVDRRAVVDQATRFAHRLRDNMTSSVAEKLGLADGKLSISTLRGGFADNREWLRDPSKPAIVVGTIDMIGSRLLFEGYGVSRGMRPYYAGFLGADSLVVLDEAHLCLPFEALLRNVAAHRDSKFGPISGNHAAVEVLPKFRLMSLSATGRKLPANAQASDSSIFRMENQDLPEPVVKQRLTAIKRLNLSEIGDSKKLPDELAEHAIRLGFGNSQGGVFSRVLVYCNIRKEAVAVKDLIDKEIKTRAKKEPDRVQGVAELLVGERRNYERNRLETWLERYGFLGGSSGSEIPTFLVATSAGEVGVDLDADHMVCDLVAYERMVQRLGRVNRRGGASRHAFINVVAVGPDPLKSSASDQKKQEYALKCGRFKAQKDALTGLPQLECGVYDASPRAIVQHRLCNPEIVERATTPAPLYPDLTRAHLAAWAMTSLKQHEGRTEVAPWLRGWEEDEDPQTVVIWRSHLPYRRAEGEVKAPNTLVTSFFRNASIYLSEKLEAPTDRVLDWLIKRAKAVGNRRSNEENYMREDEPVALLLDRMGDYMTFISLTKLLFLGKPIKELNKPEQQRRDKEKKDWKRRLASTTLVVNSKIGGLVDGMLDDKANSLATVADADKEWMEWLEDARESDRGANARPVIKFRVLALSSDPSGEGLITRNLDKWHHVNTFETEFSGGGAIAGLAVYNWPDEPGDENSRSFLSSPQTLRGHAEQVQKQVCEMAERLELPPEETDALARAAFFHDDGKAARRWQDAMNAPKDGRPYAKTSGGGNPFALEGYRHEFGSFIKAEKEDLPEATRDLILHLIAAHHGNARPLLSSAGCEDGPPSLLEAKAGEAALRFAQLQKRYGIWGLAWREAILRAADQQASREWERMSKGHTGSD